MENADEMFPEALLVHRKPKYLQVCFENLKKKNEMSKVTATVACG